MKLPISLYPLLFSPTLKSYFLPLRVSQYEHRSFPVELNEIYPIYRAGTGPEPSLTLPLRLLTCTDRESFLFIWPLKLGKACFIPVRGSLIPATEIEFLDFLLSPLLPGIPKSVLRSEILAISGIFTRSTFILYINISRPLNSTQTSSFHFDPMKLGLRQGAGEGKPLPLYSELGLVLLSLVRS